MSAALFAAACIGALVCTGCAGTGLTASACAWFLAGRTVTTAGLVLWWRGIAWSGTALMCAALAGWLVGRGG